MAKPKLYLMLGYPGAGKTMVAEMIAELTGAIHLASDRIRLELFPAPEFSEDEHAKLYKTIDELTERLLREGKDVIYDANLNRYRHRQEKYEIAQRTGAEPMLLWVQTHRDIAKERATVLADNDPRRPYGNLAPDVFERLVDQIEPPSENETHIVLDGTQAISDYVKSKLGL